MSAWVKIGKAQCEHMFSAVQPITDITKLERHVRKVPNNGLMHRSIICGYSISWSAQARGLTQASLLSDTPQSTASCLMSRPERSTQIL
jgi:hypothetical protein